jgi:trk system potassium uptake protein TrkH
VLLLCSAFIGGCAGSTGGGLKVIRILLLFKQGNRELKRLVHPNAVYSIKLGNRALPERILEAVWGFFSAYALVFIISMLAIIATGVDDFLCFRLGCGNVEQPRAWTWRVADNFATMNPVAKWILIANMLFGRLEVFTLLVLFTPLSGANNRSARENFDSFPTRDGQTREIASFLASELKELGIDADT